MHWILENNVEDLDFTFTQDRDFFGEYETHELIPDGAKTIVNNENKKQFVKLTAAYKMTEEVKE